MIKSAAKLRPTSSNVSVEANFIGECILTDEANFFKFWRDCIDQNLIINTVVQADPGNGDHDSFFFSTTMENAREFERRCLDSTAEFSLKKFYNKFDLDVLLFSIEEINDFDSGNYDFVRLLEPEQRGFFGYHLDDI